MRTSIDISLPELSKFVDKWRKPTVEVANVGVPPHLSLLYPWRKMPVKQSDLVSLGLILETFKPFRLCFNRLETFEVGIVYLALAEETQVRKIMRVLYEAFPDTKPYGGVVTDPVPHVTIAKTQPENLKSFATDISINLTLPIEVFVDKITVMKEDNEGNWSDMYVYSL